MRVIYRLTLLLALTALLGACGSTPQNRYYRLNSNANPGSAEAPAIGIGPIAVPEYLNRSGIVYQQDDNTLRIASFERWAEPLPQGIQRVMSLNLSSRLDTRNIRAFPWAASERPEYALQLWLLSLDASDSEFSMVVEWRLWRPGSDRELARGMERLSEAATGDSDGGAVAAAYSRLLARLSDTVAAAIRGAATRGAAGDAPG